MGHTSTPDEAHHTHYRGAAADEALTIVVPIL